MNKWLIYTDKELMQLLQEAMELRDGRYIKAIKQEITRRNREE